jgi:hypothetical protein
MVTKGWVFVGRKLASIDDIDAALSRSEDDFHGAAAGYVARIDCHLFLSIAVPKFQVIDEAWERIKFRLKGTSLILLPALPSAHEVFSNPDLTSAISLPPLEAFLTEEGTLEIRSLKFETISSIREEELSKIVEFNSKRALLTVDNGHFELPSGAHTSHFFRVAECLSRVDDIDCLVYWICRDLLSYVGEMHEKSKLLLVVDNPSVLILATRLVHTVPSLAITCECLQAYPESGDAIDELKDWIDARLDDRQRLFCVISVSSTGSLKSAIAHACTPLNVEPGFSVIYSTNPIDAKDAYCDLHIEGYQHSKDQAHCDLCNKLVGNSVFQIDKARYFLTQRNVETTPLPQKLFAAQRTFIERYGCYDNVLQNHVNDPNDQTPRHHAFYVDVQTLMSNADFRAELLAKVKAMSPMPDTVISPDHEAGRTIAGFLMAELGVKVGYHNTLRLDVNRDKELVVLISSSKSLLIVDDLAFSGERLRIYSRALRESGDTYTAPPFVTFFPLIVLAPDERQWSKTVRGIESDHPGQQRKVTFLYRVPLPSWDRKQCPWCLEAKSIEKLGVFENDDSDDRGVHLANVEIGLRNGRWINCDSGLKVPVFGSHSPLLSAGATATQVLFTCASALQQARTADENGTIRLNPDGFPKSTVLNVAVLRDFQNETLIAICILRCLSKNEVSEALKVYVCERAIRITNGPDGHDLWALRELLLAEKRGIARRIEDAALRYMSVPGFLPFWISK